MSKLFKVKLIVALIFTMSLSAIVSVRTAEAVPVTDIVFMIDATGSMAGEIAGVRSGFSTFVNDLSAAGVDARYAVIVFGGAAELVLDFTSNGALAQAALNNIAIGSSAGFQNNHNLNPEAGLEAIRMALGASTVPLVNNNITEDGILNFRNNARINLILATDEDSDRPFYAANRVAGQTSNEPPNPLNANWQVEVDNTAQAIIDNNAFVNMLVSHNGSSEYQYGDYIYDVSDSDFLNFDAAATLTNLLGSTVTDDSLQAQVLGAGLIGRTFNVAGANDSDFIANFFSAKVQEIVDDPGVDPIPEPATIALLGIGLVGLAGAEVRRRRKKKAVDNS